ncbi:erythromycin esterase family protein [Streptomyces sp. NBC_00859]|uniref:erythromycin esterase family protein n=1 Tax=Streptomyces sp. NBC_00859 TaxID=2903682 RepID=UPI003866567D|nr:erythromycin esterase family protein [Streptomyces sp. NBC_00859]
MATEAVTQWIRQHAHPIDTLDPQTPLTGLLPLAGLVRDAKVVTTGASTRQAHELSTAAHRVLRFLVERQGFRSLPLEGDDAMRLGLGAYIRTGTGDPEELLSGARSFWRTQEILDVIRWMRSCNQRNQDDPVRFVEDLGISRTPESLVPTAPPRTGMARRPVQDPGDRHRLRPGARRRPPPFRRITRGLVRRGHPLPGGHTRGRSRPLHRIGSGRVMTEGPTPAEAGPGPSVMHE